jgi:hypothetical protein
MPLITARRMFSSYSCLDTEKGGGRRTSRESPPHFAQDFSTLDAPLRQSHARRTGLTGTLRWEPDGAAYLPGC